MLYMNKMNKYTSILEPSSSILPQKVTQHPVSPRFGMVDLPPAPGHPAATIETQPRNGVLNPWVELGKWGTHGDPATLYQEMWGYS